MQNAKSNLFRMFKNKKGINDISIIAIILSIFLITAIIIPFVNSEFNRNISDIDTDTVTQKVKDDAERVPKSSSVLGVNIGAFDVMKNIIKLAIFDFGNTLGLPFWLDIVYTLLAIVFILVIARNIWIGGGA